MKRGIGARELITLTHQGQHLLCTHHKPFRGTLSASSRVGILFLNPGVLPRAAAGDSAVYWADSFADLGYPCFRLDLPGLGDSEGELPAEVLDFVELVNDGRYAPLLCGVTRTLVRHFGLSGMVVVGHCSGAVSAIFAAAASVGNPIQGLVLLDPYFHRQQGINKRNVLSRWYRHIVKQHEDRWEASHEPKLQDSGIVLFSHVSRMYDALKFVARLVCGKRLPKNANMRLISCWKRLATASLPMLILTAPRIIPKIGEFDYLRSLLKMSNLNNRIVIKSIEGTTHSFAEGSGKITARKHIECWLSANFPCTTCAAGTANRRPLATIPYDMVTSNARTAL